MSRMQRTSVEPRSDEARAAISLLAAAIGLVLVGLGGALLTRELINILDQDVRWWPLLQGTIATVGGAFVFSRASRTWSRGGEPANTTLERVGRVVVAVAAVGVAIVSFAIIGVLLAGPVSDLPRFETSCFEMDSILCGLQGALGGAVAGVAFGIRTAQGALRGRWTPMVLLALLALVEGVVLLIHSS